MKESNRKLSVEKWDKILGWIFAGMDRSKWQCFVCGHCKEYCGNCSMCPLNKTAYREIIICDDILASTW